MLSRTIALKHPIELKSKETGAVVASITEIRLRRPQLGDLVAAMDAAGPNMSRGTVALQLAARLSRTAVADLAALDIEDGLAVLEAVSDFMPAGLRTGSDGSPSSPDPSGSPPTGDAGGQPNSVSGVVVPLSGSAG